MAKREVCQRIQGVGPRESGAERVKEGVEGRWVLTERGVPKDTRDRKRVGFRGNQGRRGWGREAEQVLVQQQALFEAPFPDRRTSSGPMNK